MRLKWGARVLVAALVFLRAFFDPYPAGTGLGPSWQLGLTQASLSGLVFGRDVVFTYGPLSYLAVGVGVGPFYWQMLACSVILALLVAGLVAYCATETGGILPGLGFLLVILVCLTDIMPIDMLTLGLIVLFTLPLFRGPRPAALTAPALGVACGVALLMKFNIGVGAFASAFVLFGLGALLGASENRGAELRAVFALCVGFTVASTLPFARLDLGIPIAVALAAVALTCAALVSRPSVSRRTLGVGSTVAAACAALLVTPTFRAFVGTSLQVATGYSARDVL